MSRVDIERDYWNAAAKDQTIIYDEWLTDETYKVVRDFVLAGSHDAVLELGSGDGRLLNRLAADSFGNSSHFLGVDISINMIDKARAAAPKDKQVAYYVCTGRSLGFSFGQNGEKFDAAYCVTVFQHLESDTIVAYLKDIASALTDEGRLLIQFIEGTEREEFSRHYEYEDVANWLKAAGFNITRKFQAVHEMWTWVEATKNG